MTNRLAIAAAGCFRDTDGAEQRTSLAGANCRILAPMSAEEVMVPRGGAS